MLPRDSVLPKEADGKEIKYLKNTFKNWGKTVENKPAFTFFPHTLAGLRNIITWANDLGKRVRVAGYRHTWTHFYSQDNEVLISLMGNKEATELPVFHKPLDGSNPFQFVELVDKPFDEKGQNKHLCKVGPATTNEQFRRWVMNSLEKQGPQNAWTLPLNVIMVENTLGGTTTLACHGAGINNKTLSDLVTEIEFVNPKGELQKVGYKITDPEEKQIEGKQLIKTAAACFGMLGVVTSITVKLDQLTFARMQPIKPRLALAVPPPAGYVLPKSLPIPLMRGITADDLKQAEQDFISRCENDYYSEWFWFSLHNNCWVNTWKNNGDAKESKNYPSYVSSEAQETEEYLFELANKSVMRIMPAKCQTNFISDTAMDLLPDNKEIITPLIDALHFKRGIQNMLVQDMEFEIPIPALENGKPDWSICQKAWWDVITTVYEWLDKKGQIPMRLPLEMRIMGGSDITMAPQHGNKLGTCSIEVLTLDDGLVDKAQWQAFMQAIADKWSAYTDFQGKPLNVRPHWAKQWEGLTIQRHEEKRKDILEYIKQDAYKNEIPEFKRDLDLIAKQGGYTLSHLKMFSNPLLDKIFYEAKDEKNEEKSETNDEDETQYKCCGIF